MNQVKSHTGKSGAYVHAGIRDYQVYAELGRDALVAVLEIDTDCPGRVFTYFMRGGMSDGAMSVEEFRKCAGALSDLLEAAAQTWPNKMKERPE